MRRWACDVCGGELSFTDATCATCATEIGYFLDDRSLRAVHAIDSTTYTTAAASGAADPTWHRCLNFAWGCNWMVAIDGDVWCGSCRLTRGRPDMSSLAAVAAWSTVERIKRRVVDQLCSLGLALEPPGPGNHDGIVFDIVHLIGGDGATGHRSGVVTIDLREVDDEFRERARIELGEPDRTVLGHVRHEIGHHCWHVLVERGGHLDECRAVFGDERRDYGDALAAHYAQPGTDVPSSHISAYAAVHPSEDWAETFAHYLAVRDGIETADVFGLSAAGGAPEPFSSTLRRWRHVARALDEIEHGLGHRSAYPFLVTREVEAKLAFIDDLVRARPSAAAGRLQREDARPMHTARLDIEATDHEHVDGLIAALDHPSVGDYIGGPDVTTAAALHERIDVLRGGPPAGLAEDHWLNFVIRRRDDATIIGRLEATLYDGWGEIAYLVGPPYQGNGYATEGVRWLVDHLAEHWGISELWATVDPRNAASIRLLDRVGFVRQTEPARIPGSYDEGDLVYRLGEPAQPPS